MGRLGSRNRFNHTSWVAIVTLTDRPKSVRNRCVIEVYGCVFVLSRCFFDISVGVRAFVIGLSQISSFFSFNISCLNRICSALTSLSSEDPHILRVSQESNPDLPIHSPARYLYATATGYFSYECQTFICTHKIIYIFVNHSAIKTANCIKSTYHESCFRLA